MRAQRRAWRCLVRKPGKSLLLVLVMLLTSVLILGTTVVIEAVVQAEHALSAQTQARLVCESSDAEQPLTPDDVSHIARLDGVQSVNRCLTANVTAEDCTPVTRSTSQTLPCGFAATIRSRRMGRLLTVAIRSALAGSTLRRMVCS